MKKTLFLASLGSALEFYDFVIFIFFAKTFSILFFPNLTVMASPMAGWILVAMNQLARVLGGVILGYFGDRWGRKKGFLFSLVGMALPSLLIACLPTYQTIGVAAPILLTFLRLIQGFSIGGELPGALIFASEFAPNHRRAWSCSLVFLGVGCGSILASSLASSLFNNLSPSALLSWGWRIPFFMGGILGVISFYLRRHLQESPVFLNLQKTKQGVRFPLQHLFKKYPIELLQGVSLTGLSAIPYVLCLSFMPTYLSTFFYFPLKNLMWVNTLLIPLTALFPLVISYWADKSSHLITWRIGSAGLFIFSYSLYQLFNAHSFYLAVFSLSALLAISSFIFSVFSSLLIGLFPAAIRYSGVALTYNMGFAVIGGLTPLFLLWMIQVMGNRLFPCFYLMFFAGLGFITSFFLRKTQDRSLQPQEALVAHLP
jgi:MFS family permease